VSLTELRTLLAEMDLPSSTPGLTGAERRDALARRLHEARGDTPLLRATSSISLKGREADLARYTMNELRRLCEEFSVSTVTAGLAGDARRTELARRIASGKRIYIIAYVYILIEFVANMTKYLVGITSMQFRRLIQFKRNGNE